MWFSDERCVSPKDARSNYRMVRTALLSRLHGGACPHVHRIQEKLGSREAADEYERWLADEGPPRFDLVLLGLGADGHTASLFPGQESLLERERLAVGIERPGQPPFVPRVSLMLPALSSTRGLVFLVTGARRLERSRPAIVTRVGELRSLATDIITSLSSPWRPPRRFAGLQLKA